MTGKAEQRKTTEQRTLIRLFERLMKDPSRPASYAKIGEALIKAGRTSAAAKYLKKALQLDSSDRRTRFLYADALYRLAEWNESAKAWLSYLELEPEDSTALKKLADCCYLLGRYGRAAEYSVRANSCKGEECADER